MAEKLESYDWPHISRGPKPYYPYETWFDGGVWRVSPDEYRGEPKTFVSALRAAATRSGLKIKSRTETNGDVVFQATPRDGEPQ